MAGVWLALVLTAGAARGQESGSLYFVGGLGYEEGGPGPSLVDALAAGGWADARLITGAGWQEHPTHFREGLNVVAFLGARYRFGWPFSIELLGSNGQRGHAEGYNAGEGEQLVVRYASMLLSASGGLHLGPFRLAAGPILNATSWEITRNTRDTGPRGVLSVGTELSAAGKVRAGEVYLSLRAGIRRFPATDLTRELNLPISTEYRSFFFGITVLPAS